MKITDAPRLTNQQQRRHLKDRLEAIHARTSRQRWDIQSSDVTKEPALIRKARARIAKYEKERNRAANAEIKRLRLDTDTVGTAVRQAKQRLLFSTPEDALSAVIALEKRYPAVD
jgi:hypothetical protein